MEPLDSGRSSGADDTSYDDLDALNLFLGQMVLFRRDL